MTIYPKELAGSSTPVSNPGRTPIGFGRDLSRLRLRVIQKEWEEPGRVTSPPSPFIGLSQFVDDAE